MNHANNRVFYGSRRRFLKDLAKGTLSSAALNASLCGSGLLWARGALAAETAAPRRLVVIHVTNGAAPDGWHPTLGNNGNYELPISSAPFADYKNQCLFMDNLTGEGGHGGDHPCVTANKDESIDVYTAKMIGADNPFSSLHLAVSPNNYLSRINGTSIPMELNPFKAFDRLFPAQPDGGGANQLSKRRAVFTANYEALEGFRAKLNSVQKTRLDLHLDSLEKLESRIEKAFLSSNGLAAACKNPAWAGGVADRGDIDAGVVDEATIEMRANLHFEVIANALRCDLTRVATLSFGNSGAEFPIPGYGMWHGVIHGFNAEENVAIARTWFSKKIADFMGMLARMPDSDGNTVLDNTLIYLTSDMGNGSSHDNFRTPIMLAGGAGGALKVGQSVDMGGAAFHPILDTVATAMGLDIEAPGYPGYGGGAGPFSGLLV